VATVADGVVTPLTAGTTTITVTTVDGSLTDTCEVTVEAPVVNTAPGITAIANQETTLGELFTYTVVATDADGDTLTYTLTTCPLLMEISAAGVITWTPEFATQLGPHEVVVEVSDGELVATEDFILTVEAAPEPDPLVIDIDVPDAYVHPTKGPIVAADCYDVVVTFSDNSITEGKDVYIRWYDENNPEVPGDWIKLEANTDDTEFTTGTTTGDGKLCFAGVTSECKDICIELKAGQLCCAPIIITGDEINITGDTTVKVDSVKPCASFTVTIEDCEQDPCAPEPGASMSWTTLCDEICDVAPDCCDDVCSGVGDWSFVLDQDEYDCFPPCDEVYDEDCPIFGEFECGCLLYDDPLTESVNEGIHVVEVSIEDNVGNEFTDTWTITFDTDELTDFVSGSLSVLTVEVTDDGWEVEVDYGCTWDDCDTCFPPAT